MNQRVLFVVRALSQEMVDVAQARLGNTALSGSLGSALLVADELAARGGSIGVHSRDGRAVRSMAECITDLSRALEWVGDGLVVCIEEDESVLARCRELRQHTILWTHLPLSLGAIQRMIPALAHGIVVVSDTVRLPFLHSPVARRIARIYNPINPFFDARAARTHADGPLINVVFAGYIGMSKGVHRLLEVWRHVRRRRSDVQLRIAGSSKLYGQQALGPYGIADTDFEQRYLAPLAAEFGSLAEAGITFLGLLGPQQLRREYQTAALGIVNLNVDSYTETFCCAAVEMIATGLPVFSVEAGALPETIGHSDRAYLSHRTDAAGLAQELLATVDRTTAPDRPRTPSAWIHQRYGLGHIALQWEKLLDQARADPGDLARTNEPWNGPKGTRYYLERVARATRLGRPYRYLIDSFRNRGTGHST